ncbi:hypothetical protein TSMEX_000174 [Taenia solium]|eukprot:TsM_000636100 transcript=TsM_000636100 gene=TsM_000636100
MDNEINQELSLFQTRTTLGSQWDNEPPAVLQPKMQLTQLYLQGAICLGLYFQLLRHCFVFSLVSDWDADTNQNLQRIALMLMGSVPASSQPNATRYCTIFLQV